MRWVCSDESHERRSVLIIRDQNELILRIVRQFIRAHCSAGRYGNRRCKGMGEIDEYRRAIAAAYHERPRPFFFIVITSPVDGDNSIGSGRKWDLIKELIVFRVDHGDIGFWRRELSSAIGEVVLAGLGVDPTNVEAREISNIDGCQQFIRAQLVLLGTLGVSDDKNRKHCDEQNAQRKRFPFHFLILKMGSVFQTHSYASKLPS